MSESKTYLRYTPDEGFVRVTETASPADMTPMIAELANRSLSVLPCLGRLTWAVVSPATYHLIIVLPSLSLCHNGAVLSGNPPVLKPDYYGSGVKSDALVMTYIPPSEQLLVLQLTPETGEKMLVAVDAANRNLYGAGIPNTYENGQLCTGGANVPNNNLAITRGLESYVKLWLSNWADAAFNSDLNGHQEELLRLTMRFDPATGENIPVTDWRQHHPQLVDNHSMYTPVKTWASVAPLESIEQEARNLADGRLYDE